jgi:hypothetical protein
MDDQDVPQKLVSDAEKRLAIKVAHRKLAARLGIDPELLEAKISFGLQSNLPPERQHELAIAMGVQMALQSAEEVVSQIRTREELDELVQSMESAIEPAPTIVRAVMERIKDGLPRRGGPGRRPLLDDRETEIVCKEIHKLTGKKNTQTEAISAVSKMCPVLLKKAVGTGTLWKAWAMRDRYDLG